MRLALVLSLDIRTLVIDVLANVKSLVRLGTAGTTHGIPGPHLLIYGFIRLAGSCTSY